MENIQLNTNFHPIRKPINSGEAAPNKIIKIRNLCLCYSEQHAIKDVNLDIRENSITAIIGPSGCGKSSLLCCINRMTDLDGQSSVTGQIYFDDNDIFEKGTNVVGLRRQVGMLFQKPNPFPFSIWKNLELPLKQNGIKNKGLIRKKIKKSLMGVGLWEEVKGRLHKSALSLSGGQQQRLCLARTLILEPRVILMDEPCSALDPISSEIIQKLILELRKSYTIIIVTHNLFKAKHMADYVALFWNENGQGKLIEFGETEKVFANPQHHLTKRYINGHY